MSKVISNLGVTIPELECTCVAHLTYDYANWVEANGKYVLKRHTIGNCTGQVPTWQYLDPVAQGVTWVDMDLTEPGFNNQSVYDPFKTGARGWGYYRIKMDLPYCTDLYTNALEAYEVKNCGCGVSLYYDYINQSWKNGGGIKLHLAECSIPNSSYVTWQFNDFNTVGSNWVNIPSNDPGFLTDEYYDPNIIGAKGTGLYRVKVQVPDCGHYYSSILETYLA